MGCTVRRSSAVATARALLSSCGAYSAPTTQSSGSMAMHFIIPVVMVPVLSSAMVPQLASFSSVSPPRTSTPRCAHAAMAATYASGVIRNAHGAAAERKAKER
eukprot:9481259-Pyramimonas_sp.AAC.1